MVKIPTIFQLLGVCSGIFIPNLHIYTSGEVHASNKKQLFMKCWLNRITLRTYFVQSLDPVMHFLTNCDLTRRTYIAYRASEVWHWYANDVLYVFVLRLFVLRNWRCMQFPTNYLSGKWKFASISMTFVSSRHAILSWMCAQFHTPDP